MTQTPDDASNRSLTTYGVSNAPSITKRSTVALGQREVGGFGYDHTADETVYYTERTADDHRYRGKDPRYVLPFDGDGHGLSMRLFARIHDRTGKVYVIETDTTNVYQFAFSQFVDGTPINVDGSGRARHPERGYEKDPQKVVPIADAVEVFQGHAPDMFKRQPAFR